MNRKSKIMKAFSVIASAVLFMTLLTGCNPEKLLTMGAAEIAYENAEKYTAGDTTAPGALNISVNWIRGNVYLESGDVSEVTLKESGNIEIKEEMVMHSLLEGDTLDIQYASCGTHRFGELQKDLHIIVPRDTVLQSFNVNTVTANVILGALEIRDADMQLVSGKVSCSEPCIFGTLDVESTSGTVSVCGTFTDEVVLITTAGDISIELLKDEGFEATFNRMNGKFYSDLETTSKGQTFTHGDGKLKLKASSMSGNLTINIRK